MASYDALRHVAVGQYIPLASPVHRLDPRAKLVVFGLLVIAATLASTYAGSLLMLLVRMLTQQALEDEASLKWFEEQASIRNSLTRELNHRVKNTLANVLSIVSLTRRRAHSLDEFAEGLDGRIRALVSVLESPAFARRLACMGGYRIENPGRIRQPE